MRRWQDIVELLVAIWLVASPFALAFFSLQSASVITIFIGALVIMSSQFGIAKEKTWAEWMTIVLSIALGISPWALGFAGHWIPTLNALLSTAILLVVAMTSMLSEYRADRYLHHSPGHQG